jgi:hypothetical protein
MVRLRSLTVYVDESSSGVVRRQHETIPHIAFLAKKTAGRPNHRLTRNLRGLQGLDYVRQLRGLRVLSFIDLTTMEVVRDWSFALDLQK